ncbi:MULTISPECIES: chorismate mutase [Achromobacter]|uniref:chorismate mutase n=1 Tax=Achromobacter TaxID=222 RepID=UPI001C4775C9|nr:MULTISPECIES: chorismate mutase [Achromobacter]MBV7499439.1 chorismate mutase [Achromobacter sp. ACM05]MCG7327491.1 chorismate mutase [Achromobacter sp. ACRQX]MDH0683672.1 chorismate mutase [Achromobacter animicus]
MSKEPDTHGAPLREYTDPAYRPLCANLADVRANIDRLDDEIVRLIAERAMYVKDAARFKRDAFQVSAPARQAQVFEKARALAQRHNQGFSNLEQVVDATYRAMVAAFIANEQTYFDTMKDVGDTHA